MATNNQIVVAEALDIARKDGRKAGHHFLFVNYKGKMGTDSLQWFNKKCDEHGIG